MVEEELEAQGNQLDRVCGDESHEDGGRDTEKGRNPREISKEQGDLATYWIKERKERLWGSCQDLCFEGLEGCWCVCQTWSPGKSRAGEGQATMSQLQA